MKGSKECLFNMTPHNMQIFRVSPFVKQQNNTDFFFYTLDMKDTIATSR